MDSRKEYEEFMREYEYRHEACPKCGSLAHSTTLVGYIVNMSNKEAFKDRNQCTCLECGDRHIFHDRVNKAIIRDDKLNDLGI